MNLLLLDTSSALAAPSNQGLLFACWATVIVLVAMFVVFLRAHRKEYAFAVIPLAIPPAMYIISGVLARGLDQILNFAGAVQIRIVIDLIAALIACVLLGFTSGNITDKRQRHGFYICCTLFIVVFSAVLIMNSVTLL